MLGIEYDCYQGSKVVGSLSLVEPNEEKEIPNKVFALDTLINRCQRFCTISFRYKCINKPFESKEFKSWHGGKKQNEPKKFFFFSFNEVMNSLKPSFSNPLSTNTKSCNELINRLSISGSHRDVLLTYSSMLSNRTPPDAYTFPSLLKACTSLGLLSLGLSIHQHTIVNGYSSDTFISSSLVHFYSKFGDTHIARKVFDAMPERNVVPWSAIIGCYSRQGDVSIAFSLYNDMRRHEEVVPNSVTVLGLLSGISEFQHLQCLHACVIQSGFQSDIHVGNSLLNLYGRCGKVEIARKLFESMDHKDLVSWNSLVSGYSQGGNVSQSVELLNRMRFEGTEPDHQTFGSVLSGIANECMPELGKLVHGQIITAGIGLDVQFVTTLIVMYLKCGNLENAFQLFHGIRDRDVVLWTAMISGLVQNDRADEALNIFYRMIESGLRPSSATVATALSACAQLGSLKKGSSIHGYFLRQRLQVDVTVQNSLVNMYSKCGHLEQSWAVFETISDKDLVTWNTIVASFAQDGHLRKALILFNEMRMANQRPDSITVVSLLQVCASFGALHQGKWIHNFVIRNGIGTCISIDTALIDMYSKCGVLSLAQTCFDMMPEQDLVSWSAIITAYGSHGKGQTALKNYSEFLLTGIQPNYVTFLSVLSACSHAGLVSEGMRIFQTMTEDFGIEPKLEHRACIVDLLSRAGQLQEAYGFVKREFPEPSIDVLGILLDACRTCRNSELGIVVAREIISLKPENAENYVQLAHSYASMSRWDGVGEALLQMRSLGLKKVPGWSCIELLGAITTFFVDHTSHPQHEEIKLMLNVVSREMQDRTSNYQVMEVEKIT